ncbi:MAG: type IV pilin N-terminal domain-containing protein [Methanosarcinales archaeon]|nr:type IV pilin N-terminal domain-containing protein [ANME-2 cluster archaeon]MDW7775712.1 type IV pilin N-terminal domain-containing protein [Methanosarcinales archaeon]
MDNDSGISPVIGIILITFLVVIFSAAAYAVVGSYSLKEPVIADIEIISTDVSNQEVVLVHRGGQSFDVSEISILISINGETLEKNLMDLPITGTPPGFLHSVGGVLWGTPTNQTHDNIWDPGDKGDFNIAGTNSDKFNPGDLLMVTVYHRPSGTIISSPERRV